MRPYGETPRGEFWFTTRRRTMNRIRAVCDKVERREWTLGKDRRRRARQRARAEARRGLLGD